MNKAKKYYESFNQIKYIWKNYNMKNVKTMNHKTIEDVKELIDKELKYATLWRLEYLKGLKSQLEKIKL